MQFFYGYLSPNSDHERSEFESSLRSDSTATLLDPVLVLMICTSRALTPCESRNTK